MFRCDKIIISHLLKVAYTEYGKLITPWPSLICLEPSNGLIILSLMHMSSHSFNWYL